MVYGVQRSGGVCAFDAENSHHAILTPRTLLGILFCVETRYMNLNRIHQRQLELAGSLDLVRDAVAVHNAVIRLEGLQHGVHLRPGKLRGGSSLRLVDLGTT